jgi:hypothetical protein
MKITILTLSLLTSVAIIGSDSDYDPFAHFFNRDALCKLRENIMFMHGEKKNGFPYKDSTHITIKNMLNNETFDSLSDEQKLFLNQTISKNIVTSYENIPYNLNSNQNMNRFVNDITNFLKSTEDLEREFNKAQSAVNTREEELNKALLNIKTLERRQSKQFFVGALSGITSGIIATLMLQRWNRGNK